MFEILFVLIVLFGVYAVVSTRRKKPNPFPKSWHNLLLQNVQFYKALKPDEQQRFQNRMMLFLSEVFVEAVGFNLQDLDKILVASSAVIPVFYFPEWHYNNLSTVLIYPDHFNEDFGYKQTDKKRQIAGVVGNGRLKNQMILSRKALHQGFDSNRDNFNTGIHEFIHLIDNTDGITDGVPEALIQHPYVIPWLKTIHKEMEAINNNRSDIRHYGGTNEAEFLAVASEYFFEQPERMKVKHPDLYQMLKTCFHSKQIN